MVIKNFTLKDLADLEKCAQFPLGNLNLGDGHFALKKSIFSGNHLIGSFFAHMTTEISLVLDNDMSNISKAKAINFIFTHLMHELPKLGFDDAHIFIKNNDSYVDLLKKHFTFEEVVGKALVVRKK